MTSAFVPPGSKVEPVFLSTVTPGKLLCGIRTLRSTLLPCGFARALVRGVLCWIGIPFFLTPIPAAISLMLSSRSQRIGDRVAALEANLASAVPKGAVLTWFSKNGAIPSGWGVCDGTNGPNLRNFFLRGGSALSDLSDAKQGSNSHTHSVGQITTTTPAGITNTNVKQEGGAPLSVYGTDHTHKINAFNTQPQDNLPEYKYVLFLCR